MITKDISKYPYPATYYIVAAARKNAASAYLHLESGIFTMNNLDATYFEKESEAEELTMWCALRKYCGEDFFYKVIPQALPINGLDIKRPT